MVIRILGLDVIEAEKEEDDAYRILVEVSRIAPDSGNDSAFVFETLLTLAETNVYRSVIEQRVYEALSEDSPHRMIGDTWRVDDHGEIGIDIDDDEFPQIALSA